MMKKLNDFLAGWPMTVTAGVFLLLSFVLTRTGHPRGEYLAWVCVIICGIPLAYLSVWRIIHNKGVSKISSALLITAAMIAALCIGDLFAAGEVGFIMELGALLEDMTTERAKKGLKTLISLTPRTARRIVGDGEETVPAEAVLPGDVIRHCANSATIHRRPDMALDMVRAGISLYGYPPVEDNIGVKPAMRWTAKISYIKELPAGEYISYGRTYRTDRPARIATVTCGYADGYHRAASGKAEVLIRGKRVPVLGRICMDQMMADITGIDDVQAEDEAVLMGTDGDECISAEDIAKWSGTISYEILVDAANRVERVFSSSEENGKD